MSWIDDMADEVIPTDADSPAEALACAAIGSLIRASVHNAKTDADANGLIIDMFHTTNERESFVCGIAAAAKATVVLLGRIDMFSDFIARTAADPSSEAGA